MLLSAPDGTRYTLTAAPPMRFGLTASLPDYGTHFKQFPGAAFCRVFFEPTHGLLPWTHPKLLNLPAWVSPWVSFKDAVSEAALSAWLDGVTRPTIVTFFHEKDNGKTLAEQHRKVRAEHFARTRAYHQVIAGHRNRPLVQHIPIQTLQWTEGATTAGHVKGDGDWRLWHCGVGDGAGMDCYVGSWETSYPDPERWLRIPFELAEGAGRRLWLPELGSVLLGGDKGAGRAAWIRDVTALLRDRGCAGAAWWCAIGKPGSEGEVRDFHLSDAPSATAWLDAINGGRPA